MWLVVTYLIVLGGGIYFIIVGEQKWFILILLAIWGWLIFLGFWHNVSYQNGIVTGVLFPSKPISIKLSNITDIRQEMQTWRYETRRCLAIYDARDKQVIRVSLSLFVRSDVRKLMQIIHDARPDLTIPEGWAAKQP
jgi:hypothetical protein